jgi:hypothetical protein
MEGKESGKARHIFANPLIPEICVVLYLGNNLLGMFRRLARAHMMANGNYYTTQQFH